MGTNLLAIVIGQQKMEECIVKIIAGFCLSMPICLLFKIQIIKVIVSINDLFSTLSIKLTPLSKEELLLGI